jgi:hypothetical protein
MRSALAFPPSLNPPPEADSVDLTKLTTSEKLIAGSGILFLIAMFLPWYGIDTGFGSVDNSGWDYFLGAILPLILIVVMVAQILVSKFSPNTNLPDPPVPWSQVHLFAGVVAAILVILRLLIGSDDVGGVDVGVDLDRKIGLFLGVIAGIGAAVGGFLKSQEGDDSPAAGGDTGTAPF